MKAFWHSALSLALGFAGGIIATRVFPPNPPAVITAHTVRAERFELWFGPDLPLTAYWGLDRRGKIVIAFMSAKGKPLARFGEEPTGVFRGGSEVFAPFTELSGNDGRARFQVRLDPFEEPFLAMGTGTGDERIFLGPYQGGEEPAPLNRETRPWGLEFRDPSNRWASLATVGMTTPLGSKTRTGYLLLQDSRGKELSIEPK